MAVVGRHTFKVFFLTRNFSLNSDRSIMDGCRRVEFEGLLLIMSKKGSTIIHKRIGTFSYWPRRISEEGLLGQCSREEVTIV